MSRRSTWTYRINGWNIMVSYELDDRVKLIFVKISPLYPYEAEIISHILGKELEWSYDEERREVTLLAGTFPIYFSSLDELKKSLIRSLFKAVPGIQSIGRLEHLGDILLSKGWIVIRKQGLLHARKFAAKRYLSMEVRIAEIEPGRSHVRIVVTAFPRNLKEVKALDGKLGIAGVPCHKVLSYPLYKRRCNLGERFNWEIPSILDEFAQIIVG